ncbi:MAG: hypothetical protein IPM92_15525 [Saprospiraceae bacterium]|nr:hypothetical protein [Saprospiraceae bacterium]
MEFHKVPMWNGILIPGQSQVIDLPCIPIPQGNHSLSVTLGNPDNQPDFYPQNNILQYAFEIFEELKLTIDSLSPTHCISDGKLWAHATGGTGPYKYRLNKRSGSQTDSYFQLLLAGNYILYAEDLNGCQTSLPLLFPIVAAESEIKIYHQWKCTAIGQRLLFVDRGEFWSDRIHLV